ncbi:SDR family NAD(P)-dependent oxidoreductase [candidate division KSB1 bacterium]|nr:SDR family NAD(P)-dependent oxidoreductase [candidate division KSB1 bacterium]
MKKSFADKVVVICGASSGIGRETALLFAEDGARLVLSSRREEKLQAVAQEVRERGVECRTIPCDIEEFQQIENLVEKTLETWGQIDVLVITAGQYIRGRIVETDISHFKDAMRANFFGVVELIRAVLPHMVQRKSGYIGVINTLDAKKGLLLDAPYVSAKSALDGFCGVLRQELHATGVGITSVFPGRIDTPMIEHIKVPAVSAKLPPQRVAKALLRGIRRNKAEVVVPWLFGPLGALNEIAPKWMDWLFRVFKLEGKVIKK